MASSKVERKKAMSSYQFGTSEQVETYKTIGESFINAQSQDAIYGANFFEERIGELEGLKAALLSSERQLFDKIGLFGPPGECLRQLQRKVDAWNASGAYNLINGNAAQKILELMKLYQSPVDFDELAQKYSDELVQSHIFEEILLKDGADEIEQIKLKFVQWVQQISGKGTRGSIHFGKDGEQTFTGILQYINIIKDERGKFKLTFQGNISSGYKVRLANIFNKVLKQYGGSEITINKTTENEKKKMSSQIATIVTSNVSGEAATFIKYEIESDIRFENYGYANNFNVIKGFLGEVYWNAFFSFLSGQMGRTVPTGTIKDQSGKSITIDMLFEGFGFQIKNFNINDRGEVAFHGNMGAGNLIVNRAQISPSEALLYLFGAWAYNQPVEYATPEYQSLWNDLDEAVRDSAAVFQLYADRIIGLDKIFSATGLEQFSQPSLYFNTFFLINTKIVPGSSIIQAILDSLKTSRPQIRFEADYSKPPANSTWPTSPPTSAYNAAQLAGVNYEITLNISNILRLAYNRADDI